MGNVQNARDWEDVHHAFALHGMEIRPHGNGLAIKNKHGKQAMKASFFNRSISYKKLCQQFGEFTSMEKEVEEQEQLKYKNKPLQNDIQRR